MYEKFVSIPTGSIKMVNDLQLQTKLAKFQLQLVRLKSMPDKVLDLRYSVSIPTGSIKIISETRTRRSTHVSIPTGSIKISTWLMLARLLLCFNSNWFD